MTIQEFLRSKNINGFHLDGGTDKDTEHSYCGLYQEFFDVWISELEPTNILEIGTYKGGWAFTMHQLLPLSSIYTIDIEDNFSKALASNMTRRFFPTVADAYTEEAIKSFGDIKFDMIIDDGPHTFESQKWTINNYMSLLHPSGLMIIEDVRGEEVDLLLKEVPSTHKARVYDLRKYKGRWDDIIIAISRDLR